MILVVLLTTGFLKNTFNFQDYVFSLLADLGKKVYSYNILTPTQVHTNFLRYISKKCFVESDWIASAYGVLQDIILYFWSTTGTECCINTFIHWVSCCPWLKRDCTSMFLIWKWMWAVKFREGFQDTNSSKKNGNTMPHRVQVAFALSILLFIHEVEFY